MTLSHKIIRPYLLRGGNTFSKWLGYFGLGIGVLLLLVSMQMFINIQYLLSGNNPRKNGFDFISIYKIITNENMGSDNTFTPADLDSLKDVPEIESISPLISNQFRVQANAGQVIPFSTDLFLESVDDDFIDTLPPGFKWKPGQVDIPVILSSELLEMYNVFAPAQGLPQLSPQTISSVNIILQCNGAGGVKNFRGNVLALSDRINSVLVPKSFLTWSNEYFAGVTSVQPSRVLIKTKDANNPALINYLDRHNFHMNKDKTKFGRVKGLLQNILGALAVFGILVVGLALMLFSFYLQLMIARNKDNLQLLVTLGYPPKWLGESVVKTWFPVYLLIILTAIGLTAMCHYLFINLAVVDQSKLTGMLHWSVFLVASVLVLIAYFMNAALVKRELKNIVG